MASASQAKLQAALDAVMNSYHRLEAAAARLAAKQSEQVTELDAALTQAVSENNFLKNDNLRLSNQLQSLQQDFLALQEAASLTVDRLDASVKQIDLMLEH